MLSLVVACGIGFGAASYKWSHDRTAVEPPPRTEPAKTPKPTQEQADALAQFKRSAVDLRNLLRTDGIDAGISATVPLLIEADQKHLSDAATILSYDYHAKFEAVKLRYLNTLTAVIKVRTARYLSVQTAATNYLESLRLMDELIEGL